MGSGFWRRRMGPARRDVSDRRRRFCVGRKFAITGERKQNFSSIVLVGSVGGASGPGWEQGLGTDIQWHARSWIGQRLRRQGRGLVFVGWRPSDGGLGFPDR